MRKSSSIKHFCLNTFATNVVQLMEQGQAPAVIFDIDSTLLDVTPRNVAILKSAAQDNELVKMYPNETQKLLLLDGHHRVWGVRDHLRRLDLHQNQGFYRALIKYWEVRFFSNDFLQHDQAYLGAVDYLWRIQKTNVPLIYLTGRDTGRMLAGTIASLDQLGFPRLESNIKLELKPHHSIDDAKFKIEYLNQIQHLYTNMWLFENEPGNIHPIRKALPQIQVIFFDSVHSGTLPVPEDIPHLSSWNV